MLEKSWGGKFISQLEEIVLIPRNSQLDTLHGIPTYLQKFQLTSIGVERNVMLLRGLVCEQFT